MRGIFGRFPGCCRKREPCSGYMLFFAACCCKDCRRIFLYNTTLVFCICILLTRDSNFYFPVFYRETISAQNTSVYIFPFIQPGHGPKEGICTIVIFSVFPVILRHNYIQSIFLVIFAIIWHICCWIRGDVKSIYTRSSTVDAL